MTDGKLRIPRVALALLVLGGMSCEEDNGPDRTEDAGGLGDAGPDDIGDDDDDDDEVDAGAGDTDAGRDAGGVDDGGGQDGGSTAIDVTGARITRVAQLNCAHLFECDLTASENGTEQECVSDYTMAWTDELRKLGAECLDSYLDFNECYADAQCENGFDECATSYAIVEDKCPVIPGTE